MPGIDGVLSITIKEDADELRMGTDRAPQILQAGTPLTFHMPPTPAATLEGLLGDLLSEERQALLANGGKAEFVYETAELGRYDVAIALRDAAAGPTGGFDVVFLRRDTAVGFRPPGRRTTDVSRPPIEPDLVDKGDSRWRPESKETYMGTETVSVGDLGIRLVALVERAGDREASDLHVAEGEIPVIRSEGALWPLEGEPPMSAEDMHRLAARAQATLEQGRSQDFSLRLPGGRRIRANVYRAQGRLAAAVRLFPPRVPSLEALGLPTGIERLVNAAQGLVLVCGPTGCGKTTTLAALAQNLVTETPQLLISLEDPVEYELETATKGSVVRQREIGTDVADFATGLRDALREDPDVLLVGEMRDPETIALAVTAAETGQLVLASTHARSAAGAVQRILDGHPAAERQHLRLQLADSLRAVLAQRLLPRASGRGQIVAVELLWATRNIAALIRDGKTAQIASAIQAGGPDHMVPLEQSLADLVKRGLITRDVAKAVAPSREALRSYLK